MCAAAQPRPGNRHKVGSTIRNHATTEAAVSRLFRTARDNASDILVAVAASSHFHGFLAAVHAETGKLSH